MSTVIEVATTTTTTTASTTASTTLPSERFYSLVRIRRLHSGSTITLSPFLSTVLVNCCEITLACWDVCWSILNIHPFDEKSLLRISIALIGCQQLQNFLDDVNHGSSYDPIEMHLAKLPSTLLWGVPVLLSSLIGVFVTLPYWFRPHHHDTFLMTALISLFCLEAILPFLVLTCTSLLLLRQVSWVTGLSVLAIVWLFITFMAHWIRCTVYQNMGHG